MASLVWVPHAQPALLILAKVYAEICATIDSRSSVKQHVRDHIDDLIVTRVSMARHGTLMGHAWWGRPMPLHECGQELYVDPHDGIVNQTARLRRKLGLPLSRRERRRSV